jgi:hypothetical protein
LELGDEKVLGEMHGVSLVPTWRGENVRDYVMSEYQKGIQPVERALRYKPDFDYRPWLRHFKAIRVGQYKYHWYSDGADMLFDLASDPGERRNLIAEQPERASEMRSRLESTLLSLQRRDFGDKMRNHGFRNVRWDNVAKLNAWGFYREIEQ